VSYGEDEFSNWLVTGQSVVNNFYVVSAMSYFDENDVVRP